MKLFLSFLFLTLTINTLSAQNQLKKYVPGVLVKGGDSTNVEVKVTYEMISNNVNLYKMQFEIKVRDETNGKYKAAPDAYDFVKFEFKGETFQLVSKSDVQGIIRDTKLTKEDKLFLRLIVDGKAQILSYTEQETISATSYGGSTAYAKIGTSSFVIQVDDGEIFKPSRSGKLNESLSRIMKDCPEVLDYMENDEIHYNEIFKLVELYNSKCSNVK